MVPSEKQSAFPHKKSCFDYLKAALIILLLIEIQSKINF